MPFIFLAGIDSHDGVFIGAAEHFHIISHEAVGSCRSLEHPLIYALILDNGVAENSSTVTFTERVKDRVGEHVVHPKVENDGAVAAGGVSQSFGEIGGLCVGYAVPLIFIAVVYNNSLNRVGRFIDFHVDVEDAVAAVYSFKTTYVVALGGGGDAVFGIGLALTDGNVNILLISLVHFEYERHCAVAAADACMFLCIGLCRRAVEVVVGIDVAFADGSIDSIFIYRHFLQPQHSRAFTSVRQSVGLGVGSALAVFLSLPSKGRAGTHHSVLIFGFKRREDIEMQYSGAVAAFRREVGASIVAFLISEETVFIIHFAFIDGYVQFNGHRVADAEIESIGAVAFPDRLHIIVVNAGLVLRRDVIENVLGLALVEVLVLVSLSALYNLVDDELVNRMNTEQQLRDIISLSACHFGGVDVCSRTAYLLAGESISIAGADVHGIVFEVNDRLCNCECDGAVAAETRLERLCIYAFLGNGLCTELDTFVRRKYIRVVNGGAAHNGEDHTVTFAVLLVAYLHNEVVGIGIRHGDGKSMPHIVVFLGGAYSVVFLLRYTDHSSDVGYIYTVAAVSGSVFGCVSSVLF